MQRALIVLFFVAFLTPAFAQDCNQRCCKTIRITKWDKNHVCDAPCKFACEAGKEFNVDFHVPSVVNNVIEGLNHSCAFAFKVINTYVIVTQPMYPAGSERLLEQAKAILIQIGAVHTNEFDNVSIRWGKLRGSGQAPDRNTVFLSEAFLHTNNLVSTTLTLAHEMVHIRQYRRINTDEFKCRYSRDFVRCNGCQDRNHPLEREAYDFEASVAQAVNFAAIQHAGRATACYTPVFTCSFSFPSSVGTPCTCQHPGGPSTGFMR